MIVVDVNLLVAAYVAGHPHHPVASSFLSHALSEDTVIVPDPVWSGFLRVVTHPRILESPASIGAATTFVRAVTAAPGYRHVAGLVDGLEPFLRLSEDAEASGNLIPDAYIAAVATAHGCPVATFDRDFRRFDGLRIVTPR